MGREIRINRERGTIEATRSLRESGTSMVLSIPTQILDAAGFSEGDEVELVAEMMGDEILMRRPDSPVPPSEVSIGEPPAADEDSDNGENGENGDGAVAGAPE